jgi:hypothetical protein
MFTGVVTFARVPQSGIEDTATARRVASRCCAATTRPSIRTHPYLLSVPQHERLNVQGLWGGRRQKLRTVAGMVALITAVLASSAIGLLARQERAPSSARGSHSFLRR